MRTATYAEVTATMIVTAIKTRRTTATTVPPDTDREPLDPNEVIEALCYKHITLILLPNPEGERDLLAMEIDLQFTKGHKRNPKR